MVTVGSILRGTLQFVRSNIPAIAAWSGLLLVSMLLMVLLMRPIYEAQLATMQTGTPVLPSFGPFFWLIIPVMTVLFLVIWAAGFRAVLRPADSRFFYLRLGMDEARLFGLLILLMLMMIGLEIVGTIGVVLVGGVLSLVVGKAAGMAIGAVLGIALGCAFLWAAIRISPAGPLTILERKISIRATWRLSRGHFWPMFGAYLIIVLGTMVVYFAVTFAQMGSDFADMLRPTDPDAARRLAEHSLARYQSVPSLILYAVLSGLVSGMAMAFQIGMTAVATRDLLGPDATAAETPSGPWSN